MSLFGALPVLAETLSLEAAAAVLAEAELSDGHLATPPTERRLAAMLEGVADPAKSLGMMPPMFGDLTVAAVAYNCVLAGCRPAELPVVLAAAEACLAPDFNLLGLLTTTGSPAVATVVHGPIAERLAMNAGTNCLGPGNRANAAIGRAMALVMRNIGGARETTGDMATIGQPGKYAFCFADGASGLLPGLPARKGMAADASAVTVLGVSGTIEVLPLDDRDTPQAILLPVAAAMIGAGAAAGSGRERPAGEQYFILPPELAEAVVKRGWDLARIQAFLAETDVVDIPGVARFARAGPIASAPADIHPIVTGGPGAKMAYLPLWGGGSRAQTRFIRDFRG